MRLAASALIALALVTPTAALARERGAIDHGRLVALVDHQRLVARSGVFLRRSHHFVLLARPQATFSLRPVTPASKPNPAPRAKPAPAPAPVTSVALSADERALVAATNNVRVANGLRPLAVSAGLVKAASVHSAEMLSRGYFDHSSANGEDFSVRLTRYYPRAGTHYWSGGENIAYGCPDLSVSEAMDLWMHSPGHRANILHAEWNDIGVAIAHAASAAGPDFQGDATTVMTVDFGVRR